MPVSIFYYKIYTFQKSQNINLKILMIRALGFRDWADWDWRVNDTGKAILSSILKPGSGPVWSNAKCKII